MRWETKKKLIQVGTTFLCGLLPNFGGLQSQQLGVALLHASIEEAICGDGLLVVGEECDDGNQVTLVQDFGICTTFPFT